MIRLENVSKTFVLNGQRKTIMRNVTMDLPSKATIALLGRNGAGKSTLMNMIGGVIEPSEGRILTDGSISYPVGFSGSFHSDLTGIQNTRFVARLYGVDTDDLVAFVRQFAELGKHFNLPLRTYSSGMKARLSFAVSMGIPFDFYLIDEVNAVGDAAFRKKSGELFRYRMEDAGMLFCSHSMKMVQELCTHGAVLEDGDLVFFPKVRDAVAYHKENMTKVLPDAVA